MIKIVTDSSCDLSEEIVKDLGITVVPLSVRFGEEIFKERVTITDEQFYHRLVEGSIHPATIQPNATDFIAAYEKVGQGADGIVSTHITLVLSGTINSARQAKDLAKISCPLEIVDSKLVSIALGAVVIAAAEAAKQGKPMAEVLQVANEAIANTRALALLDTLKYLQAGGRIGKATAFIGTLLSIKPIISIKDGGIIPFARARSFAKGLEQLVAFVGDGQGIDDILIAYTTVEGEARDLAERISKIYTRKPVKVMRLGTTLGVHVGPGAIVLVVRDKAKQ